MSSIVVSGDTSGSITLSAPAVAGASVLTLPVATDTLVGKATTDTLTNKTLTSPTITGAVVSSMGSSVLTSGTAQASTSGTSIDFTGIPSWAKRITVMFSGVSTNGSSVVQVQLGSGTIATTGYFGTNLNTVGAGLGVTNTNNGSGFIIDSVGAASYIRHGAMTFMLLTGNTFTMTGSIGYSESSRATFQAGSIALGSTLDRVRITTVNGTDAFDAGSINIMYE
jgi:hypothetical protein